MSQENSESVDVLLEEAERGMGGLKRLTLHAFRNMGSERAKEMVSQGSIILTSDDVDVVVVMAVADYFALAPPTQHSFQNPLKKPRMKIFEDVLFREVV